MTSTFDLTHPAIVAAGIDPLHTTGSPPNVWIRNQIDGYTGELHFVATGTQLRLQTYASNTSLSVTVDGVTNTIVANGNWTWTTLFTGLTDAPHTVAVKAADSYLAMRIAASIEVTGAAPALARPEAYQAAYKLNPVAPGFILEPDWKPTATENYGFTQSASVDSEIRFRANPTQIDAFMRANYNCKYLLYRDGVKVGDPVAGPNDQQWVTIAAGLDGQAHDYAIAIVDVVNAPGMLDMINLIGGDLVGLYPSRRASKVVIGDSIVCGGNSSSNPGQTTEIVFGRLLATDLNIAVGTWGASGAKVIDAGGTGLAGRAAQYAGLPAKPDEVVILMGVNDQHYASDLPTFKATYRAALDTLIAAGAKTVYACRPLDQGNGYTTEPYNTAIQQAVAEKTDPRCVYIDTTGWIVPATDTADQLHPNAQGNIKIAARLKATFAAHANDAAAPVPHRPAPARWINPPKRRPFQTQLRTR